ncbi:MAG: replicative DNA helicase [Rhodospirillaceae bacterium]|nr:replicative DNA helicase [Rhodospirillaceae bacterium]MCY4238772.1 replicative DNA helicase [Rhodospirillaceae bacterium]
MEGSSPGSGLELQQDSAAFRTPPHNFEAEMALLGALLANNRAFDRVADFLQPDHFADARHGRIFDAIRKLIEIGQVADPITLKNLFESDGSLDEIGGTDYLARLAASVVTIINTQDYGRTIFDRHLRRALIEIGTDIVNEAYSIDLDLDALAQIEMAEQNLYNLATSGDTRRDFQTFTTALGTAIERAEAAFKQDGHISGIATGLSDLDKLLGGLQPSELLIIAARPSMGKTALGTNIAFNAARAYREEQGDDGKPVRKDGAVVALFNLEMSAEELATRILAEQSGVSSHRIRRGDVSGDDFTRFVQVAQELNYLPLYIDDSPELNSAALRSRCRRLHRQHGLSLIIIDYVQLLRPVPGQRPENRVQELSEITRSLKALAKELKVPVVAMAQLSRKVEEREDKRPQLADLRESGSIEQDADVVMFIYRDEYYLQRQEPQKNTEEWTTWSKKMDPAYKKADIIVAKQRHGPIGSVKVHYEAEFTRFSDLAQSSYDEGR